MGADVWEPPPPIVCCRRSCCGPGSQCCAEADPHWHMQDESILFHDEVPADGELVDCSTFSDPVPTYALVPGAGPTMAELRAASVERMLEPLRGRLAAIGREMAACSPSALLIGAAMVPGARSLIAEAMREQERQARAALLAWNEYDEMEDDITTELPSLDVAVSQFKADLHAALAPLLYATTDALARAVTTVRVWSAKVRDTGRFMALSSALVWRSLTRRRAR